MKNKIIDFQNIEPDWITQRYNERIQGSFQSTLGMYFLKVEQGHTISCTEIPPEVINHLNGVHGGFLYTIADSTGGFSSIPLGSGIAMTTVDGHMQYLRPSVGVKRLYTEAECTKAGKRISFVDIHVYDEQGTLLAKGSFTFAMLDLPIARMPVFDINNLPE